ncbi:M20 family metallopeptidase [Limobrevibacterium gyesilva]|uniref:M20 family metallopeptidase n=1 Tax=Limobrevibacterium gyesilva TaxID=2991712 RepID=A0AA41YM22_9PROT|nr:M20 family metallopeptidase [Limobrevibacterium gyesilva]MCW3475959.1 M20 family metallopeptidase [Limobrevibacterium gyesilva]
MNVETTESRIASWLATQQEAMIGLLRDMVDIDSGSYNKPGIDAVGAVVERFLTAHGIPVERLAQAKAGDCLRAAVPWDGPAGNAGGNIVLMGHRDTVFPDGEAVRRPFTIRDGVAYGPGVADMKAGLVMNAFVLAAFAKFGGAPAPLVGLFTGDEEIGSPEGRPVIEAEARRARVVFNSEPGRVSGNVVTGRKGGVFSVFRVTGRAAHSGGNFSEGISAIEELARKIQAIHALTDLERGITLNVGLVSGGQSVNTVAPWAEGQIDLRYVKPEDRDDIMARIETIIGHSYVPGTKAELTIRGEFLPLTQSAAAKKLFELYVDAAAASGFTTAGEFTGGCADSGFTAGVGAPTICAVGPVGGKAHSPDEFLRIDSLVPRAQACARAILRLERAGL